MRKPSGFGNPNDVTVEKLSKGKIAQYLSAQAPKLAKATEKEWQTKRDNNLQAMKTGGPKTRRSDRDHGG